MMVASTVIIRGLRGCAAWVFDGGQECPRSFGGGDWRRCVAWFVRRAVGDYPLVAAHYMRCLACSNLVDGTAVWRWLLSLE